MSEKIPDEIFVGRHSSDFGYWRSVGPLPHETPFVPRKALEDAEAENARLKREVEVLSKANETYEDRFTQGQFNTPPEDAT